MAKAYKAAKRANRPNPREDRNNIIKLNIPKRKSKEIKLLPRNISQENYIEALNDDNNFIVIASGCAGTGKTMLSTQYAIKGFIEGQFEKIVITRPNVSLDDKDIGFLPGDMLSKMSPWMMPILDVFAEYYTQQEIQTMIQEKIIEMVPLAYIRGRTFKHSCIILDEAQGTTETSFKAVLTRIGDGSKIIVTGDLNQSDRQSCNGLKDFMSRLKNKNINGVKLIEFGNKDIERHKVISDILELYGE